MDFYYHHVADGSYQGLERLCHFPRVTQLESDSWVSYPHSTDEKTKIQLAPILLYSLSWSQEGGGKWGEGQFSDSSRLTLVTVVEVAKKGLKVED